MVCPRVYQCIIYLECRGPHSLLPFPLFLSSVSSFHTLSGGATYMRASMHERRRCVQFWAQNESWRLKAEMALGGGLATTQKTISQLGRWVKCLSENIVGDCRNSHRPWTICLPYGCYLLIFLAQEMICQVHSNVDDGAMGGAGGKQSLKLVCMLGCVSMFGDIVFL